MSIILTKKQNQINAGTKARQDGENVKNGLTTILAYDHNLKIVNPQIKTLFDYLNVSETDVLFIHTKSHSDGKISCSKSDLRLNIEFNNKIKKPYEISLKSTFNKTQLAIHSVNSFEKNLLNKNIVLPTDVKRFLSYFSNTNIYPNQPNYIYDESKRRNRFSLDEINQFDSSLFIKTQDFFKENAKDILNFLISSGSEIKKDKFANTLAFCDKNLNSLLFIDIEKLIFSAIKISSKNNSFCLGNKWRKVSGITTLSLYAGLITLQMKGSGEGSSYHNLQFNISGSFIKKWIKNNLIESEVK